MCIRDRARFTAANFSGMFVLVCGRAAARLNSGVRLGKKQHLLLGWLIKPLETIARGFYSGLGNNCFGWFLFAASVGFAASQCAQVFLQFDFQAVRPGFQMCSNFTGGACCFGCKSHGPSLDRPPEAFISLQSLSRLAV